MATKQCSVDGCDRPVNARGFCRNHYERWRKRGDPKAPLLRVDGAWKRCKVEDCNDFAAAKGYCGKHYQRFKRTGDPLGLQVKKRGGIAILSTEGLCIIEGCCQPRECRGYCSSHYYRSWKHGDPLKKIRKRERAAGEGTFNNGYHFKSVRINGRIRQIGAHRLMMEEKLGRKLRANENVHHINGDRSDNRIENLELWVKTQPCGQRPVDLVTWAKEIIRLYGDEVK